MSLPQLPHGTEQARWPWVTCWIDCALAPALRPPAHRVRIVGGSRGLVGGLWGGCAALTRERLRSRARQSASVWCAGRQAPLLEPLAQEKAALYADTPALVGRELPRQAEVRARSPPRCSGLCWRRASMASCLLRRQTCYAHATRAWGASASACRQASCRWRLALALLGADAAAWPGRTATMGTLEPGRRAPCYNVHTSVRALSPASLRQPDSLSHTGLLRGRWPARQHWAMPR